MFYTALLLDDIHINAIDLLKHHNFNVIHYPDHTKNKILEIIDKVDVIIYRLFSTTIDGEILSKAKNLKCIIRTGAGMGNIDFAVATKNKVIIMDTRHCNSFSAAEFIFGSILNLARKITLGDKFFRSGKFERNSLWGTELAGKTLGIIGFGHIGKNVCKMATSFNMKVISFSPHITPDEIKAYLIENVTLDELFRNSDFISIAFPGTLNDLGMINKEKINLMKTGVYLINASSMGVFNYDDVADALKSGKIGGLVIDRPSFDPAIETHQFLDFPNVIFSPTLGSHTHEGQTRCVTQAINQAIDYLDNGVISNQILR